MTLVVYAIIEADSPSIEEPGLDGRPLRTVRDDDLAAVVSEHEASPIAGSAANLWDYERVMERLMSGRTVLPMRFGTALADDAAVRAMLRERADELRAGFERVRGAVELGIRAGWRESPATEKPATATGEGTAYMLERVALHRQARDLVDRLDPLAGLARDIRLRLPGDGELPVREAYLVNRDRVNEFTERVREIDERNPEIQLVCTGPWPPYSFAAADERRRGGRG
jgi:Gas vesicle synthesis protein GvpL/GvpF